MTLHGIDISFDKIEAFCVKWKVRELCLFGSVLRDDFRPDSDIDMLVTFDPGARWTLWDQMHMEEEMASVLGRKVDLVTRRAIEESPNYLRRRQIIRSARPIYAA